VHPRRTVAAALLPVLLGLGFLASVLVTRAPAAGVRVLADSQTLQVVPYGPGSVSISSKNAGVLAGCDDNGGGAGNLNDCQQPIAVGDTVTLSAVKRPDEEGRTYSFSRWSNPDCWTQNPCVFVMPDEPVSIAPIFGPAEFHLNIRQSGSSALVTGTNDKGLPNIDCGGGGDDHTVCSVWYPVGTAVTLTASGNFTGWYRDCYGTDPTCTIITEGWTWVNATFDARGDDNIPDKVDAPLKVKVSGASGGKVTSSKSPSTGEQIDCSSPESCRALYKFGEPVTLTAAGNADLTSWGRACSGTPTTCRIAAGTYQRVDVTFAARATTTTQTTTQQTTTRQTTTQSTTTTATGTNSSTTTRSTTTTSTTTLAFLTKVGVVTRKRGITINATVGVQRRATGRAILLRQKAVISSWPLKLAKGRHVVKLNLNRRPRAGWYVLRLRLADQDGNGAVLNRNVHVVYKKK
jgi:hypothetical protein